jgi:hypothetical protein
VDIHENITMDFSTANAAEASDLERCLQSATDKTDCCKLWNRVSSFLVHDEWYTKDQIQSVLSAAMLSNGLTAKQKMMNLPQTRENSDDWADQYDADQACSMDGAW